MSEVIQSNNGPGRDILTTIAERALLPLKVGVLATTLFASVAYVETGSDMLDELHDRVVLSHSCEIPFSQQVKADTKDQLTIMVRHPQHNTKTIQETMAQSARENNLTLVDTASTKRQLDAATSVPQVTNTVNVALRPYGQQMTFDMPKHGFLGFRGFRNVYDLSLIHI